MNPAGSLHGRLVSPRRVNVLGRHLSRLLPEGARVLDVGCGDGEIDRWLMDRRGDLEIRGLDVAARPGAKIPVGLFDGAILPFGAGSFDFVMMVDVLHHTKDPRVLLREARRVATAGLVIKDHDRCGFLAFPTLCLMDWVGNAGKGVSLPHNYWRWEQWSRAFAELGLSPDVLVRDLGLYPRPLDWIFGRSLHFLALLS